MKQTIRQDVLPFAGVRHLIMQHMQLYVKQASLETRSSKIILLLLVKDFGCRVFIVLYT